MNISCLICSDMIAPSAEIYTTTCGHLFHYTCLIQWIERSSTCPQCRCKATEKTIHRIFFNIANTDGITDDIVTLQYKMDNLEFQIKLKDKDIQIGKDKNKKLKEQNISLRNEVKDLEHKQNISESAMHALKEQVAYFKLKAKDVGRLNDEVIRLKDKLKELEHVQLVVTGSKEQVSEMLRHNKDTHSLSLLVYTLKKELLEADRKYKLLNTNIKHLQNDNSRYRRDNSEITEEIRKLKSDIDYHRECESQKHSLKKTIKDLEGKIANMELTMDISRDSSLNRIMNESPAPYRNRSSVELDIVPETVKSPSILERVQSIKDAESPYLSIKSSNMGLSCLLNPKYKTIPTSQPSRNASAYNIFKNPPDTFENVRTSNSEYNYNGLGGHSKEDIFPSPKPVIGLKRTKSATISSSKFRKLAPNKKISNFFSNADE